MLGLGLVWCYCQGMFRVRVSLGFGSELGFGLGLYICVGLWLCLWLELTIPKSLTLTIEPNPQNEIVEGHP